MSQKSSAGLPALTVNQVKMEGIVKRFPGVVANDHIDFEVHAGEIHALLGENGAGKTTLMRILYGMFPPDEGKIWINGGEAPFNSPADAIGHGIGMVHQHFMLVPSLSVAENVALGLPSSRGFLLDLGVVSQRIEELSERYHLPVHPEAMVWQLGVGEQQRVEIIKALYRGASLLILDEPTAVLTPQEAEQLFEVLREMRKDGKAVVFISHKLKEVTELSDRVTVLRNGSVIGTVKTADTNSNALAKLMVGRDVRLTMEPVLSQPGPLRFELKDVWAKSDRGLMALQGVNLEVHAGEILGVAGVSGNGQSELEEVIVGTRTMEKGSIVLEGQDISPLSPDKRAELGLSTIPEERMRDGAVREMSVWENLLLEDHGKEPFARGPFLNAGMIRAHCEDLVSEFDIKAPSLDTELRHLSGGNIQKLILARELCRTPRVLLAAQPTRGVDIGSTEEIHQRLLQQKQGGMAVLLISEDLDEILDLSDRIAVIYEGRIMGILKREEASMEKLGLLMAGVAA